MEMNEYLNQTILADVNQTILENETKVYETFVGDKVNIEAFRQFVLPDYLNINPKGGILTKEQNIDELRKVSFSSLKILDSQVRSLSQTSALIFARVQLKATIHGQKIAAEQATSTVWVNRGGKWLVQLHTASFWQ